MSPVVRVIDDDPSCRTSLERVLRAAGLDVSSYSSSEEFLENADLDPPGCVVLDPAVSGCDGLELQAAILRRGSCLPMVFLSGQGDIPVCVRAMKSGVVDYLTKPVQGKALLQAVRNALAINARRKAHESRISELRLRLNRLTPRELQVMKLVVRGRLNKQIAQDLGTAEHTIKVHRGRVMRKLELDSVPDLVLFALELGLVSTPGANG